MIGSSSDDCLFYVTRLFSYNNQCLGEGVVVSPQRSIDFAEDQIDGLILAASPVSVQYGIYTQSTDVRYSEVEGREVYVAGVKLGNDDTLIQESACNHTIVCISDLPSDQTVPFFISREILGSPFEYKIKVRMNFTNLGQTPDYQAHLAWSKWFSRESDKLMPLADGSSYDHLWKEEFAIAQSLSPPVGFIFPFEITSGNECVRGIIRLLEHHEDGSYYALMHGVGNKNIVKPGISLYRKITWSEEQCACEISETVGHICELEKTA